MTDLAEAAAELLERTRAEQGLPSRVTDRVQLGRVANIVLVARDAAASRASSRAEGAA